MGLYEGNAYGDLGRLRLELQGAVRLDTDTGLHAKQWTREEARAYLAEELGESRWVHESEYLRMLARFGLYQQLLNCFHLIGVNRKLRQFAYITGDDTSPQS